jgi:hypothetical protein
MISIPRSDQLSFAGAASDGSPASTCGLSPLPRLASSLASAMVDSRLRTAGAGAAASVSETCSDESLAAELVPSSRCLSGELSDPAQLFFGEVLVFVV